jgi:hypothetical protein
MYVIDSSSSFLYLAEKSGNNVQVIGNCDVSLTSLLPSRRHRQEFRRDLTGRGMPLGGPSIAHLTRFKTDGAVQGTDAFV